VTRDRARITVKGRETVIEIEGSEKYVESKLKDPSSLDELLSKVVSKKQGKGTSGQKRGGKTQTKRGRKKEGYQIVKDLDLSGNKSKKSLKDFYREKQPTKNLERNAVFVYYLKNIAKVPNVNKNHVYTCYKDVEERVPGNLKQSLLDTSHHKGWVDTTNMDDLKISTRGENFVEHDLPLNKKSK
jgi:hypothetical protein